MQFARSGGAIKQYGPQNLNQVVNLIRTVCDTYFYGSATRLRNMVNLAPFFSLLCLDLLYQRFNI